MKYPQFSINAKSTPKEGELVISGYISEWNENAGNEIVQAIQKLEAKHEKITIVLRNCYGGSVYEGIPTFTHIQNSKKEITTRCEGLAASMGFILFLAGKNRVMTPMSRLMSHRITAGVMGTSLQMRNQADEMDRLEDEFKDEISNITGKTKEFITNNWMKEGVDKYFTASQAEKAGFATEVIPPKSATKNEVPNNLFKNNDVHGVAMFFNSHLPNTKQKPKDKMELSAANQVTLGLKGDAPENEINAAVARLAAKNTELEGDKTKLQGKLDKQAEAAETARKLRVKNILDVAFKAGKFKAERREGLEKLADTNMEVFEDTVSNLIPTKKLPIDEGGDGTGSVDTSKWTAKEWRQNDTKGFLAMKVDNPEEYKRLNAAEGITV